MSEKNAFSEESLREIAEEKFKFRLSVRIHLWAYICVNGFLVLLNLLTSPFYLWSLYPILGWGVGLAEHATAYILYAKGVYPMSKRAVYFHVVAYVCVMVLLFFININIMGYAFNIPTWAFIPVIAWGSAVAIHGIVYRIYFAKIITEEGEVKSRKDIAIEKEMEKLKKERENEEDFY